MLATCANKPTQRCLQGVGAPDRTRTCNLRLRRPLLYPVELRAPAHAQGPEKWSGQRDLNPRLPAPKAGALPDCAMPRVIRRRESGFYRKSIASRTGPDTLRVVQTVGLGLDFPANNLIFIELKTGIPSIQGHKEPDQWQLIKQSKGTVFRQR